ncbi:MAG: hypothetical protein U9R25_14180 [Chloroflexota bacterium]|nr:hypothetical protein [Chloroflexota bacterium]
MGELGSLRSHELRKLGYQLPLCSVPPENGPDQRDDGQQQRRDGKCGEEGKGSREGGGIIIAPLLPGVLKQALNRVGSGHMVLVANEAALKNRKFARSPSVTTVAFALKRSGRERSILSNSASTQPGQ